MKPQTLASVAVNRSQTPPERPNKTRDWKTFSALFGGVSPLQAASIVWDNPTDRTLKVDLFVLSHNHVICTFSQKVIYNCGVQYQLCNAAVTQQLG